MSQPDSVKVALDQVGRVSLDVVVVGRFPPPIGGVSVFVERKYESLRASGASRVDLGSRLWLLKVIYLAVCTRCLFFLNTTNLAVLFVFYGLGILGRTRIYDHNSSRHYWGTGFKERCYLFFVRRAGSVCVVHEHLLEHYRSRGINIPLEVESPFLPPVEGRFGDVYEHYSVGVKSFLNEAGYFKIGFSASKYVLDAEGRDLYGLETLCDLVSRLREAGVEVKCLLAVAEWREHAIPDGLRNKISRLVGNGDMILLAGQYEFWPVYRYLDCFLRLTSTDGDSVSVREALYYKCPVVASDVVPRPDSAILYSYAEVETLFSSVMTIVSDRRGVWGV